MRTALAAVRQWPMCSRYAIHFKVIVLSRRTRAAICLRFETVKAVLSNLIFGCV